MPSILPTRFLSTPTPLPFRPQPTYLPFPAHSPSAPIPLPFCPQPALFPFPAYSPSVRSPLSFRPQPTPRPSAAHSPLSVTPRTCSSVTLSSTTSNIFPCPLVLLSTCHIPLSLLAYNLFTRLPVNSSTYNVTHRTCSPVTLSPLAYNLLTRLPINSSTCPLLTELVHLLPCLLSHTTC